MNRSRKNILFLASWFPKKNSVSNGIFIKAHAHAINEHHNVFVIHVSSENELKEDFELDYTEESGLKILNVYYPKVTHSIPVIAQLQKLRRYKNAFYQGIHKMKSLGFRPDIVHLNVIMPMAVVATEYCKYKSLPLIITEHWTGYMEKDGLYKGRLMKYFTSEAVRSAKTVITVSEGLKQAMLDHGLEGNYRVIPNIVNGIDTVTYPAKQPFKIGMVAALYDRQKNISGAIEGVKLLLKDNHDIELHIVGMGEDEKELTALCVNLINTRIFFRGYLEKSRLFEFYSEMNTILVSSHFETFSIVAAEALSCGIPVIAAKCGGPEEFLNESCGIVMEHNDPLTISGAITKMMNGYDSYDREKISIYAKTLFDRRENIRKFDEVYASITS